MNIVFLSGGSGKRLWPLSNDIRSKQFIQMFKNESGELESMIQRSYRQVLVEIPDAKITFTTLKSQASSIRKQLNEVVDICVEPCRKDTFPAIALVSLYLYNRKSIDPNEPLIVSPIDLFVENDFYQSFIELSDIVRQSEQALHLLGIEPTYPSEKYGYIIPEDSKERSKVHSFHEKPSEDLAKKYLEQNALWNSGVFGFKLSYMLDKTKEILGFTDYEEMYSKYHTLEVKSFDYAVSESEQSMDVLRYSGSWMDLGTWNTLTEAMQTETIGNSIMDSTCHNTHIINELDIPILGMGCKDLVISASAGGILVSDKIASSQIKPYIESIKQGVMFAEKSWGSVRVVDVEENSMSIKVVINQGQMMNYHSHENRDEMWTILSGTGRTIVDGMEEIVTPGDVVTMEAGCRHTIIADTELHIMEVQLGKEISVHDKVKYELEI